MVFVAALPQWFDLCCTYLTSLLSVFRCHVNICHWTPWRSGLFVSTVFQPGCLSRFLVDQTSSVILIHASLSVLSPVGFILCHSVLNSDAAALSLWKLALQSSTCLCLFRDEVFHIHKAAEDLFVNIRGWDLLRVCSHPTHTGDTVIDFFTGVWQLCINPCSHMVDTFFTDTHT